MRRGDAGRWGGCPGTHGAGSREHRARGGCEQPGAEAGRDGVGATLGWRSLCGPQGASELPLSRQVGAQVGSEAHPGRGDGRRPLGSGTGDRGARAGLWERNLGAP